MELTESMFKTIAKEVFDKYTYNWYGHTIDSVNSIIPPYQSMQGMLPLE